MVANAENVSLKIHEKLILNDVSLELEPGKITGLLGPNGAGKTSLLKILSGEWAPSSGSVSFLGQNLHNYATADLGKRRAFLHQESSLDFAFTVLEVVLLGRSPHMSGGEKPEDYEISKKALKLLDMEQQMDRSFPSLSGGEKQRVHLARCLAQILDNEIPDEEKLLFLDEPTNNLDLSHQHAVFSVAKKVASRGTGVVMVLHDLNQAFQYCDYVYVLEKGNKALEGNPCNLFNNERLSEIFEVTIKAAPIPGTNSVHLAIMEKN